MFNEKDISECRECKIKYFPIGFSETPSGFIFIYYCPEDDKAWRVERKVEKKSFLE